MDFNFSLNFRRTFHYVKKNSREYIKTDFKYLLILVSGFLLLVLTLTSFLWISTNLASLALLFILGKLDISLKIVSYLSNLQWIRK
jgi:hypothetical protein